MNDTLNPNHEIPAATTSLAREKEGFSWETDAELLPAKKSRGWLWWIILLVVMVLIGVFYFVHKRDSTARLTYKTAAVARGNILQTVTADGQVQATRTVTVGSQVSGRVTAIYVDYNSTVTNGQVVAQIDPSTYQQTLAQAEADLASAKAAVALAQWTYERDTNLYAGNALAKTDLESAEIALQQNEATVKYKEAALKSAQVNLAYTTIYSPINGVVISRAVDVGQTVAASMTTPTLFNIAEDLHKMNINASVSEADVGDVQEGQLAQFTVDAFPTRIFQGRVTQLRYDASTNDNVVDYTTVIQVDNDDLKLRPTMTANVSIITADRKNVLRVSNAAFRYKPSQDVANADSPDPAAKTIYVIERNGSPVETLKAVSIKTGASDGTATEVLNGLTEGEQVVTGESEPTAAVQTASGSNNPFGGGGMGGPPQQH